MPKKHRLYLEGPFLHKLEVFELYKTKCIEDNILPLSSCYFYNFLKEKKFSIFMPSKDKCDYCSSYEMGQVDEDDFAVHIAHKNRARDELEKDTLLAKQNIQYLFTMDCMAVKLCPYLQNSALYYSMKLKVHNMTLYNNATGQCENYWWHEGEGDLEASIFTTIILKHLEKFCIHNKKSIILYSDGCGYQNSNSIIANALLNFSIKHGIMIEQKFLIKGHTQMQCDSAHSLIERKMRGKDIYLPSDFIKITRDARKNPAPFGAMLLSHDFFLNFKAHQIYNTIRPGKEKGDPEVKDLRALQYNFQHQRSSFFKLVFDDPYIELPLRRNPKINLNANYERLYNKPLPINLSKWKDLQNLKKFLPQDTHAFYDTLEHSKVLKPRSGKM